MFRLLFTTMIISLLLTGISTARDRANPYEELLSGEKQEFDYDEDLAEQWKEQTTKIPTLNMDALRPLTIDHGPIGATVYVDDSTVEVNSADRVVRYWMVLKNKDGGFGTMNYEGLRCATNEYKIYGYTSARRPSLVKRVKTPKWRPIRKHTRDPHFEMARDYFCSDTLARQIRVIVQALKGYSR